MELVHAFVSFISGLVAIVPGLLLESIRSTSSTLDVKRSQSRHRGALSVLRGVSNLYRTQQSWPVHMPAALVFSAHGLETRHSFGYLEFAVAVPSE